MMIQTDIDSRGVARVTLNRPEKHNAFDDTMIAQLRAAFDSLASDAAVRVVVVESLGKSFSAGADLGWMKRMAQYDYDDNLQDARLLAGMLSALHKMPQPTIARVQGGAYGGAVGLISCCDMAVAADTAAFALTEVKIGLIPATISPYVIRAIGERASRRYFATAERFDANVAQSLGLINDVVPADQLDDAVNTLLDSLLANGPEAVKAAKQLVADFSGRPIDEALIEESCERIARIRVSAEGQEGLEAFLNKRSPGWLDA
ncbi:MAG: enoyl-CoA hydratase/isomerase family protein [Halieaceae bacterium]